LNWVTRSYEKGDEERIPSFLAAVLGKRHSSQYWSWLHWQNPAGYSLIRLAECGQEPVAHVAGIPVRMNAGQEFGGFFVVDAATSPQYRRQGVMKMLMDELGKAAAARGLAIGYGLVDMRKPMQQTAVRLFGAQARAERMKDLVLVLDLRKVLRKRHTPPALSKLGALLLQVTHKPKKVQHPGQVEIEQISTFDESFDELWNKVSLLLKKALVIKRSRAHLCWRYSLHPENNYLTWVARENEAVIGYVVARHQRTKDFHTGLIADIFGLGDRRDALVALVSNVVDYFEQQNVELVRCQLSDDHPYIGILEDAGFVALPSNLGVQFAVTLPTPCIAQDWAPTKGNHMIAWSDTDNV
jgi:GNAT superfamily N-acetyltransferase